MFAPPPAMSTERYAVIPEAFKRNGERTDWMFGKANPDMHSFLEGPIIDHDGNLIVSDIAFGRIFRVTPDREFHLIADYDGEPNGLALHPDGSIWIADHRNGLLKLEPGMNEPTVVLRRLRREGFKGLNDVLFDSRGNLYFTDQGQTGMHDPTGRVYRLRQNGEVDLLVDTIPSPNGMALSPDENILYVAVTRANQVWRLPLHADGSTTKVNIFLHLSGGHTGPDGLTTDRDGNLFVCQCGSGIVWGFDARGEPIYRINSAADLDVTAACFGGRDNKTLFVTESASGSILTVDLDVPGCLPFSHGAPSA